MTKASRRTRAVFVVYDGRNGGSKAVNQKTLVATHLPSAAPTHLGLIVYLV